MSEELPLSLRQKLLKEMLRAYSSKLSKKEQKPQSPRDIVMSMLSDERGREILEKATRLYPEATEYALSIIAKLIEQGVIKSLDAITLLTLLNRLGVPVKPDIKIKFVKRGGREVSFKEYVED
ncbi:MAG: hypothetical protein DRO15_05150 [Thermoprotei archaeon]|nr:MAG: hypothetical protein DRO15_05150 [Thermoprotei archaeon]